MTAEVKMFRDAQVELDVTNDDLLVLSMKDDPSKGHLFRKGDSIYSHLQGLSWDDVQNRFQGGNYFFANGQMIDYRPSHYEGYVASDEAIEILNEEIGVSSARKIEISSVVNPRKSDLVVLRGRASKGQLEVEGLKEGGYFSTAISFSWNPFYTDIYSDSYLERLICTNGLVATSNAMSYRIPIVNDWKENLEIADRRLQHKFQGMVVEYLEDLTRYRASVGTVQLLNKHISERYFKDISNKRLGQMMKATQANVHCDKVYKQKVFQNQSIAKMLPSHLTAYDAFNLATELVSHTRETNGSSDMSVNRIAANILFDQSEKKSQASFVSIPKLADFSDPDEAFMAVHEAF